MNAFTQLNTGQRRPIIVSVLRTVAVLCRAGGKRVWQFVTPAVVLNLAVLLPLACVLHCHIAQLVTPQAEHSFFICSHVEDGSAAVPPIDFAVLRSVYEVAPMVLWVTLLAPVLVGVLVVPQRQRFGQYYCTPPLPPPRLP